MLGNVSIAQSWPSVFINTHISAGDAWYFHGTNTYFNSLNIGGTTGTNGYMIWNGIRYDNPFVDISNEFTLVYLSLNTISNTLNTLQQDFNFVSNHYDEIGFIIAEGQTNSGVDILEIETDTNSSLTVSHELTNGKSKIILGNLPFPSAGITVEGASLGSTNDVEYTNITKVTFSKDSGLHVDSPLPGNILVYLGSYWSDLILDDGTTNSPTGEQPLAIKVNPNSAITGTTMDTNTTPWTLYIPSRLGGGITPIDTVKDRAYLMWNTDAGGYVHQYGPRATTNYNQWITDVANMRLTNTYPGQLLFYEPNGNTYECITQIAHTNYIPWTTNAVPDPVGSPAYWRLFVAKGATGATGLPGTNGINGINGVGVLYEPWNNLRAYIYDTNNPVVVSRAGRWYDILASNTNKDPIGVSGTNYWTISIDKGADGAMVWSSNWVDRGLWNVANIYLTNHIVAYAGNLFIVSETNAEPTIGTAPILDAYGVGTDSPYWSILVARGMPGTPGATGPAGADGAVTYVTNIYNQYWVFSGLTNLIPNDGNSSNRMLVWQSTSGGTNTLVWTNTVMLDTNKLSANNTTLFLNDVPYSSITSAQSYNTTSNWVSFVAGALSVYFNTNYSSTFTTANYFGTSNWSSFADGVLSIYFNTNSGSSGGGSTNASDINVAFTPINYTPIAPNVEDHLKGIDSAIVGQSTVTGAERGYTSLGLVGTVATIYTNSPLFIRLDSSTNALSLEMASSGFDATKAYRWNLQVIRGTNTISWFTNGPIVSGTSFLSVPASSTNHFLLDRYPGDSTFTILQIYR